MLRDHLTRAFPFAWTITLVDNASTDRTAAIASGLAARLPGVRLVEPRTARPCRQRTSCPLK
ncbi:hypothetical protein [Spongiactinospora sp. TRM90649]|uniref:hypothetical protein n=1 Tax=Spongiactinospora sp. TRM90649 TaxID=3031114 RepID=UPI003211B8D8